MLAWSMMTLMANAMQVIDIGMRQMATAEGTPDEMFLMVAEKIDAAAEVRVIGRAPQCTFHQIDRRVALDSEGQPGSEKLSEALLIECRLTTGRARQTPRKLMK